MDVGLVRREGAVLAVALAGPGEGEGVVAGEGDPAHAAQATATAQPGRLTGAKCSSPKEKAPPGWVALLKIWLICLSRRVCRWSASTVSGPAAAPPPGGRVGAGHPALRANAH